MSFTHLDVDASWCAYAARCIAGGFVELLYHWLERPSGVDSAELTSTFMEMVQGTLSAAKKGARLRARSR